MELFVTLNVEQGGDLARNLRSIYAFILTELSDGRGADGARLETIIKLVTELRGAFDAVAAESAKTPAA